MVHAQILTKEKGPGLKFSRAGHTTYWLPTQSTKLTIVTNKIKPFNLYISKRCKSKYNVRISGTKWHYIETPLPVYLLFILYKLTATAVISSFDVLARNKFFRKHEKNCLQYAFISFTGQALTLAGLKRPGLRILDGKRAGAGRDF